MALVPDYRVYTLGSETATLFAGPDSVPAEEDLGGLQQPDRLHADRRGQPGWFFTMCSGIAGALRHRIAPKVLAGFDPSGPF